MCKGGILEFHENLPPTSQFRGATNSTQSFPTPVARARARGGSWGGLVSGVSTDAMMMHMCGYLCMYMSICIYLYHIESLLHKLSR